MGDLTLKCSQVGVAIVQKGSDGYSPLSFRPPSRPLLLAKQVGAGHYFELNLVKEVHGAEVQELLFLSPVSIQDFDVLVQFMLSYHEWCG